MEWLLWIGGGLVAFVVLAAIVALVLASRVDWSGLNRPRDKW